MMGAALTALVLTAGQTAMAGQTTTTAGAGATFDRGAWTALAGKPDESAPRGDMVEGAIAQIPAGTPRSEVEARLGTPDETFEKSVAYIVGGTVFGGEYQALLVTFDDQGNVASAKQVSTETWQ